MNNPISGIALLLPKIRGALVTALGRFPWMLFCGLAGSVTAVVGQLHETYPSNDAVLKLCGRLLMTISLGMPLFFSLRMLRERFEALSGWLIEVAGLPLLAGWYFAVPTDGFDGPTIVVIRWMLLLAALHFFAAVSAYVRRGTGNGFWQFNRHIFLRVCLATFYSGVLTAGLELALLSAAKLFELDLTNAYENLFYIMAGCFHPVFFLAGVPCDFVALESDSEYPRGLKAFTQFALAPLVAVYTGILYAYAFKIIVTRTWPHGWVAMPVLILSGVGILAALLLHPLRAQPSEKWAGWYCRNFPRALAPLSLLLLLSVWERVGTYGVTEQRYLCAAAGGWIFLWGMVFILNKDSGIRWVPSSLSVICVLAAFGPWSAGAISKGSQLRRLTHLLEAHGMFVDGKVRALPENTMVPSKEYEDIRSTIQYLVATHGGETVRGLFAGLFNDMDWTKAPRWGVAENILTQLKLDNGPRSEDFSINYNHYLEKNNVSSAEGFSRISFYDFRYGNDWLARQKKENPLFIVLDNGVLKGAESANATPEPLPLQAFIDSIPNDMQNIAPAERMTADFQFKGHAYRIIFVEIALGRKPSGHALIRDCAFLLLEK